ncbi:hypothetical protein BH23GEM9_BH23GEM9_19690 [soil metagenome]
MHAVYARVLEATERSEEAVLRGAASRRAGPAQHWSHNLADRLYFTSQFDKAIGESRKILDMTPGDWYAWYTSGGPTLRRDAAATPSLRSTRRSSTARLREDPRFAALIARLGLK